MNQVIRANALFLWPFSILAVLFAAVILQTDPLELHLRTNEWHSAWADRVMPLITLLGDGIFVTILIFVLLAIRIKAGLALALASIVNSLSTQLLKREVFQAFRPAHYLEHHPNFMAVPGVDLAYQFSFPSGHTSAAFCLYFALALLIRAPWAKVCMLFVAVAVAVSRVYLNLHFVEDVVAGSLHGVFWAILVFGLFDRFTGPIQGPSTRKWLDYSLMGYGK